MSKLNFYLTLSSLSVLLVTIERFSFTTQIILQPYDFLRLHEVVQMVAIILFTVLIPFFVLYEVTGKFGAIKQKNGLLLFTAFLIGVYFYATGNGVHEVASYAFNTFCPTKTFTTSLCKSLFFNDYYFGNILYFFGAFLMTIPIILFERKNPSKPLIKKDLFILLGNAVVYSFAIFAYAAFDRVLVGVVYSLITMVVVDILLFTSQRKYTAIPFTLYAAITYTIGTLASLLVRFH